MERMQAEADCVLVRLLRRDDGGEGTSNSHTGCMQRLAKRKLKKKMLQGRADKNHILACSANAPGAMQIYADLVIGTPFNRLFCSFFQRKRLNSRRLSLCSGGLMHIAARGIKAGWEAIKIETLKCKGRLIQ